MRDGPIGGRGGAGFGAGDAADGESGAAGRASSSRWVEIQGPHLRITGRLELGTHRRVTDRVNTGSGLFSLSEAEVLLRDGQPADLAVGDLWVSPVEVTVIAEREPRREMRTLGAVFVNKTPTLLAIVTPGHTLTGRVYTPPEATLEAFLQSPEPAFIPMTDLRMRSLIDRHVEAEYPFALLNRRHIIAASTSVEAPQEPTTSLFDRLR